MSVASVSADGRARSSSEYWSTRPGAGSTSIETMSIAAWGGCDSRSSTRSVRSTLGSRIAGRQLQHPRVRGAIDEPQIQVDRRRGPIRALERGGQRLEQPRQHERQRLQPVDRPLELDALEESRHVGIGHERARIDATRHALKGDTGLSQPRRQRLRRQGRHLAKRREPPAIEDLEHRSRIFFTGRGSLRFVSRDADFADLCGSISRDADFADLRSS